MALTAEDRRLDEDAGRHSATERQVADPCGLPGLLPHDGQRRKSEADSENDREPDQPHGHLV
jgi:hypothetical protein